MEVDFHLFCYKHATVEVLRGARRSRKVINLQFLQVLLDAWISTYSSHQSIKEDGQILAQCAINCREKDALKLVLSNCNRIDPCSFPLDDPLLLLEIAVWEAYITRVRYLLSSAFDFPTVFQPSSLHSWLKFITSHKDPIPFRPPNQKRILDFAF